MSTVALLGTLDTKGLEYGFVRDALAEVGVDSLLLDAGILSEPQVEPDIGRNQVAAASGVSVAELAASGDRGHALDVMGAGAAKVLRELHAAGSIDGILGLGGTGGTTLITGPMRELPIGFPKVMLSTAASGQTRPYVGSADIAMIYSVVDIAGLNPVSRTVLRRAAGAIAGMVSIGEPPAVDARPLIGATMFGVTTACVTRARERLEELGYEVLVFHATGVGGESMEALARNGMLSGILDVTTTELADELVGGVFASGDSRLRDGELTPLPRVVSVGALDMVNFGPAETVPERFQSRRLHRHNATVTLMRTTDQECTELGRRLGRRVRDLGGPVTVFVPLRGVSAIDVDGGAFHDPVADSALFEALRRALGQERQPVELDLDINEPEFGLAMADELDHLIRQQAAP